MAGGHHFSHDTLEEQQTALLRQVERFGNKPVKFLGGGEYGRVYRVHDANSGQPRAIKLIPRDRISIHHIREVLNHFKLSGHINIVGFSDVFLFGRYLCIMMEYADSGTVLGHIETVLNRLANREAREAEVQLIFRQLIIALDYIHSKGVSFRDIKPENLLLQSCDYDPHSTLLLKFCDFGFSKNETISLAHTMDTGTFAYMAPEVLTGETYDGKLVDVWSCGVVLYTMMYGRFPFTSFQNGGPCSNHAQAVQMYKELTQDYINTKLSKLPGSKACKALMKRMLVLDPANRISVKQIMEDEWFRKGLSPQQLASNHETDPNADQPQQTLSEITDFLHRLAPQGSDLAVKISALLENEALKRQQEEEMERAAMEAAHHGHRFRFRFRKVHDKPNER